MSKPVELNILRPLSTPLRISLVAEHLPLPVRQALMDLIARRGELAEAERELSSAKGTDWAPANERVTEARTAAQAALDSFAGVGAASSSAVRDSASAAFEQAMSAANARLVEALDALADADRAALLWHSVRAGRPVLRFESETALGSRVHKEFGMVRSELREQLSQLPDSLD
ncbi:hypothetical protein OG426_19460 [Streptomyces canus]|uniref:hypothetical protein n=1 Tax=Streptomyces canus TaxID=58343 RepID=UPI00225AFEF3|nr:hypothetical protein [Streptomyces canus]MCX4858951.1 hypothetical protein [Streptomyces canus]WSW34510.1 hypothetical protein OG426_19460 [Streptomyces canus]